MSREVLFVGEELGVLRLENKLVKEEPGREENPCDEMDETGWVTDDV